MIFSCFLRSIAISIISIVCLTSGQLISLDQLFSPRVQMLQSAPVAPTHFKLTQINTRNPATPASGSEPVSVSSSQPLASIQYELKILQQKPLLLTSNSNANEPVRSTLTGGVGHEAMASEDRGIHSTDSTHSNGPIPVKKILHIHHYHHEHPDGYDEATTRAQEKQQEKATEALVEKQVQEAVMKNFEKELEKEEENSSNDSDDSLVDLHSSSKHDKKSKKHDEDAQWKPIRQFNHRPSKTKYREVNSIDDDHHNDSPYHADYAPYAHFHQQARSTSFGKRQNYKLNELKEYSDVPKSESEFKKHKSVGRSNSSSKHSSLHKSKSMGNSKLKRPKESKSFDINLDEDGDSSAFKKPSNRPLPEMAARHQKQRNHSDEHDGEEEYLRRFLLQPEVAEDERSISEAGDGNDYGFNDESESDLGALDNFHSDTHHISRKSRSKSIETNRSMENERIDPPKTVHPIEVNISKESSDQNRSKSNSGLPTNNAIAARSREPNAVNPNERTVPASDLINLESNKHKNGSKRNWLGLELITRTN